MKRGSFLACLLNLLTLLFCVDSTFAAPRTIHSCSEALNYFQDLYSQAGLTQFETVSNTCESDVTTLREAYPKYIAASIRFTLVPRGGRPFSSEEFLAYNAALESLARLKQENPLVNLRDGPPSTCPYHAAPLGEVANCVSPVTGRILHALTPIDLNVGKFYELEYLFSEIPATPTATPTPEKCLSNSDADSEVANAIASISNLCSLEAINTVSDKIENIDKKRCEPKNGYLPSGITMHKLFGRGVNGCSDITKRVALLAGYRLKGSSTNLKDLLVSSENGWSCFRPEDKEGKKGSIHPYKLGIGSKLEEAIVILEGGNTEGEKSYVVEKALDELPSDYPIDVTLKGNIVVKTPIELYADLKAKKITEKDYAHILNQIPRGNVLFDAYGILPESNFTQTQKISFGSAINRSWICIPPKRALNTDQCTDLSLSDDCLAKLARTENLEKGKQVRNRKGKLQPQYLDKYLYNYPPRSDKALKLIERLKPFIKIAIHAAYINGFRGKDLKILVAAMGEESTYNFYVLNPYGKDRSYGDCQYNVISTKRKNAVLAKWGTLEVLYNPKINLAYCKGLYDGGGLKHWSAYTNGRYKQFQQMANMLVNEYLAEIRK